MDEAWCQVPVGETLGGYLAGPASLLAQHDACSQHVHCCLFDNKRNIQDEAGSLFVLQLLAFGDAALWHECLIFST
jgi:hypothetical protein